MIPVTLSAGVLRADVIPGKFPRRAPLCWVLGVVERVREVNETAAQPRQSGFSRRERAPRVRSRGCGFG